MSKLTRSAFIALAKAQKGKAYKLGTPYPATRPNPPAFDCSGLCVWLINEGSHEYGDRTANGLYGDTYPIKTGYATGDMVFLHDGKRAYHVAMLLYPTKNSDWAIIEAKGRKFGVVLTTLTTWKQRNGYRPPRRLRAFGLLPDKPVTNAYDFNVGFTAQQAARFGGMADDSDIRAQRVASLVTASVIGMTECTTVMARHIQTALGDSWESVKQGYVCLFYDSNKWQPRTSRAIPHGTANVHGAICQPLVSKRTGNGIDFIVNHTRPKDVATDAQKQQDIRDALSLLGTWETVLMGDFAMNADSIVGRKGLIRMSPNVDSYDPKGDQRIDAIYGTPGLTIRSAATLNPGNVSDHLWMLTKLRKQS